jgi:hypothetical protein
MDSKNKTKDLKTPKAVRTWGRVSTGSPKEAGQIFISFVLRDK